MIYIVEDDASIRELEQYALQSNGYEVQGFESAEPFWQAMRTAEPELVILDVMLPGEDGFSILKKLRNTPSLRKLPIIMVTAKSSELDTVRGLDCGADDYLTKPFAYEELSARLRAMLRHHAPSRSPVLRVGGLEMDTTAHTVHRGARLITLTTKEYALLEYMMRNAGQVLTPGQLYDHVWDYQGGLDSNLVPVYIGYLRGKIDRGEEKQLIQTVRGFGYVLREEKNAE